MSQSRLWASAVAVAAFAAFLPALSGGFVWDDQMLVVACEGIKGLGWRHLRWMLTTFHMANWQPLGWLSLAVDYRLWGLRPFGFHLTNLLLHGANAALVYLVGQRLLERAQPGTSGLSLRAGAAAAALLFALHPARVESVAWVSERRDVLSGFFFLLCVLFHLKAWRRASLACCAAALLCKPVAVSLPLVLLILDLYPLRRLSRVGWRGLLLEKAPYAAMAAGGGLAVLWAQGSAGNLTPLTGHPGVLRLAQAVLGLGFYLEKTFVPLRLSPLYPLIETVTAAAVLRSLVLLGAAELVMRFSGLGRAARLALWAYYVVVLTPMLGFAQNGPQAVALRYSYLSCLGVALAAGAGFLHLWAKKPAHAALLFSFFAVPYVMMTWTYSSSWHDDVALWQSGVSALPDSQELQERLGAALFGRARLLIGLGRLAEAESDLRAAAAAQPRNAEFQDDLGAIIARQGRPAEALSFFERAVALGPQSAAAQANLKAVRAELRRKR